MCVISISWTWELRTRSAGFVRFAREGEAGKLVPRKDLEAVLEGRDVSCPDQPLRDRIIIKKVAACLSHDRHEDLINFLSVGGGERTKKHERNEDHR